jgi:predicted sulfurtransferase
MGKILLFYKYVDLEYPKQVQKWLQKLCADLRLTGRIIIAHEGINATVGGSEKNTEIFKKAMEKDPRFTGIDFKESEGGEQCFPRMRIIIKNEIVYLGLDPKKVTPKNGGKHLTPEETHNLIAQKPKDLVILDTRNDYEWRIGAFEGAILPDIEHFRQFPKFVDDNLEQFKDKQVLMYCTGGVRCERATTYMKEKGVAKEVYQILGGIHRYAEQFPDGFFRGKNYVFDDRIGVRVNDDILSTCNLCPTPCDDYTNCLNAECNEHFIACAPCLKTYDNTCSTACQELLRTNAVKPRPQRNTVSACQL